MLRREGRLSAHPHEPEAAAGAPAAGEPRRAAGVHLAWQLLVDLVYLALSPLILAYLTVVSRCFTRAKHRRGFLQKLGGAPRRRASGEAGGPAPSIWVHAVSVGEVLTALPLVHALRERHPGVDVSLSVATPTGMEVARKNLPDLTVFYAPFDLSFAVGRAFRRRRPAALVLLELELWPNLLLGARRRGVPVLVANGRITERSARRYALGGWASRLLFRLPAAFAAQNETYRERFLRLGVPPGRIEVAGNLKDDKEPATVTAAAPAARNALGWPADATLVLVAGSTHPGEEAVLAALYSLLRTDEPRLRLVLVPRHVERLSGAEVRSWLPASWSSGEPERWSRVRERALSGTPAPPLLTDGAVLVVDRVGELELFYALADLVFVGGSVVERGGHNLFEPARLGKAIIFGRHFENFRDQARALLDAGAALAVEDASELGLVVRRLLASPGERRRLGERARGVAGAARGAVGRHCAWIERHLRLSPEPAD